LRWPLPHVEQTYIRVAARWRSAAGPYFLTTSGSCQTWTKYHTHDSGSAHLPTAPRAHRAHCTLCLLSCAFTWFVAHFHPLPPTPPQRHSVPSACLHPHQHHYPFSTFPQPTFLCFGRTGLNILPTDGGTTALSCGATVCYHLRHMGRTTTFTAAGLLPRVACRDAPNHLRTHVATFRLRPTATACGNTYAVSVLTCSDCPLRWWCCWTSRVPPILTHHGWRALPALPTTPAPPLF